MNKSEQAQTVSSTMTGIFQGFGVTHGQFGQQYTIIDGREYITYFDLADPKLKGLVPGVRVEFKPQPGPTVLCQSPYVAEELPSAIVLGVEGEP